jgi:hypothetical protein
MRYLGGAIVLLAFLMMTGFDSPLRASMGLSPELGSDLLKFHDQKRPERKDVGRGMNELLLNEVFLKNLMKSNELFQPEPDENGVVVRVPDWNRNLVRE